MRNPFQTPFGAVFQNEVRLSSKRVAPYLMMALFAGNAILWSARGLAVSQGWAVNSDYFITRNLLGFSWALGLPLFTALIMADPVIKDFRFGIDPLIFSKPIKRGSYLLGKFFGNFFVLVCCQSAFPVTLLFMQVLPTERMIVLPFKVFPYLKHFFFFVVISHLVLAAVYFSVGTLTRNAKIVYGLAVSFYPLYIAYSVASKALPLRWRIAVDPLLFSWIDLLVWGPGVKTPSPAWINEYVVTYSSDMIVNRVIVILIAAACLGIVYRRFTITEQSKRVEKFSTLNLSQEAAAAVYYPSEVLQAARTPQDERPQVREHVTVPHVDTLNQGFAAVFKKLIAALDVEFRLLRAERSLVVLMPLAIFFSVLELAFYNVVPEISYSASYASSTAKSLLLFLLGITIFYTGEAMHRDRGVRIEPMLWSLPPPNNVLLLSKFLATLLLTISLTLLVGLTALALQFLKGHTPVEVSAYLLIYSVIILPSIVFMAATSLALNVWLRDSYLTYAASVGIGAGLLYMYGQGYKHWLYNPLLYQLWNYADLTGSNLTKTLLHRLYGLAIASAFLALAHLFFQRKSLKGTLVEGRLTGRAWSVAIAVVSAAIAVLIGMSMTARVL